MISSRSEATRRARVECARADGPGRPAQVRARRRVPHVQPGRGRDVAGGGDHRATTSSTSCSRSWSISARHRRCATCWAARPDDTLSRWTRSSPVEAVLTRFDSAGMSLGALSPEAHEALAIAMNRLGARSNSGEGGEDPARYAPKRIPRSNRWPRAASG